MEYDYVLATLEHMKTSQIELEKQISEMTTYLKANPTALHMPKARKAQARALDALAAAVESQKNALRWLQITDTPEIDAFGSITGHPHYVIPFQGKGWKCNVRSYNATDKTVTIIEEVDRYRVVDIYLGTVATISKASITPVASAQFEIVGMTPAGLFIVACVGCTAISLPLPPRGANAIASPANAKLSRECTCDSSWRMFGNGNLVHNRLYFYDSTASLVKTVDLAFDFENNKEPRYIKSVSVGPNGNLFVATNTYMATTYLDQNEYYPTTGAVNVFAPDGKTAMPVTVTSTWLTKKSATSPHDSSNVYIKKIEVFGDIVVVLYGHAGYIALSGDSFISIYRTSGSGSLVTRLRTCGDSRADLDFAITRFGKILVLEDPMSIYENTRYKENRKFDAFGKEIGGDDLVIGLTGRKYRKDLVFGHGAQNFPTKTHGGMISLFDLNGDRITDLVNENYPLRSWDDHFTIATNSDGNVLLSCNSSVFVYALR